MLFVPTPKDKGTLLVVAYEGLQEEIRVKRRVVTVDRHHIDKRKGVMMSLMLGGRGLLAPQRMRPTLQTYVHIYRLEAEYMTRQSGCRTQATCHTPHHAS